MVTDGRLWGSNQWNSCAVTRSFMLTDAGVRSAYSRAEIRRRTFTDNARSYNIWESVSEAETKTESLISFIKIILGLT